jgi:hypothetical protein
LNLSGVFVSSQCCVLIFVDFELISGLNSMCFFGRKNPARVDKTDQALSLYYLTYLGTICAGMI